jgi:pimeloyl-ACP methyl ester carboxylesterase
MHRHLPHAQLAVLPGEDHGHPAGRPDLFATVVAHFLRGC